MKNWNQYLTKIDQEDIIQHCVAALDPKPNDAILQIGDLEIALITDIFKKECDIWMTGIDTSVCIELSVQQTNNPTHRFNIKLFDGHDLPCKNKGFDKVLCYNCPFFKAQQSRCLKQIYNILKPEGTAIIVTKNSQQMAVNTYSKDELIAYLNA